MKYLFLIGYLIPLVFNLFLSYNVFRYGGKEFHRYALLIALVAFIPGLSLIPLYWLIRDFY